MEHGGKHRDTEKKNRLGAILNHQDFPKDGQIAGYLRGIVMTLSLLE